jgi:hypothetical protein
VCAQSTTLAGNAPQFGSGTWSVVNGSGTFANSASPGTTVTGLGLGANVLRWSISTGTCPPSTDDVTIFTSTISPALTALSQTICNDSALISATTPVYGSGSWSVIAGTGTITSASSATTLVTGLGNGVNVFRWTVTNPPCTDTFSDLTVNNCIGYTIVTNPVTGSPFCSTTSYSVLVYFTSFGNLTGFYTAQLSDASGGFATPVAIGSGPSSPIVAYIPANSPQSYFYRIRVVNSSPPTNGTDNGTDLAINTCNPNSIKIDSIAGSPFCESTSYNVSIPFTITGSVPGPYIAELSDASGNFASALTIGYSYTTPVGATIPKGTPYGTNYHIRIKSGTSIMSSAPNNMNLFINTCAPVGMSNNSKVNFAIYPTVTDGLINIKCDGGCETIRIEIVNLVGEKIRTYAFEPGVDGMIDLQSLQGGIYFLKVRSGYGETSLKIIKY